MDKIQEYFDQRNNEWKREYHYKTMVRIASHGMAQRMDGIELRQMRVIELDHIVPISLGYKLSIPISKMASLENLRLIPAIENTKKGGKLTPEGIELLIKWGYQIIYENN